MTSVLAVLLLMVGAGAMRAGRSRRATHAAL
jgi:hypothetical protein